MIDALLSMGLAGIARVLGALEAFETVGMEYAEDSTRYLCVGVHLLEPAPWADSVVEAA